MLKSIGKQIRKEFCLQYIVPYCISCFNDPIIKVRLQAIDWFIEVLKDVEWIEISHTDYYVFDTYILPAFVKLLEDPEIIINLKLIEILPILISIGKMLITSVNSNKQKIPLLSKDDQSMLETDQKDREEMLFSILNFRTDEIEVKDRSLLEDLEEEKEPATDNSTERISKSNTEYSKERDNEYTDAEEETIVTSKAEIQKMKEIKASNFIQSILDEENAIISWSRKRFLTPEQKIRSVPCIGYNMPLNDHDSEISDDPDQDNEIEKEIDLLREKILEIIDKIITEQDTQK